MSAADVAASLGAGSGWIPGARAVRTRRGPLDIGTDMSPRRFIPQRLSLTLQVPQIRESLEPFESVWLRVIGSRSERLMELVPLLYVKGMSQRDIKAALVFEVAQGVPIRPPQ